MRWLSLRIFKNAMGDNNIACTANITSCILVVEDYGEFQAQIYIIHTRWLMKVGDLVTNYKKTGVIITKRPIIRDIINWQVVWLDGTSGWYTTDRIVEVK